METDAHRREGGKPKSRLLAMKSRLQEKQKRAALLKTRKPTAEMAKCAGKPPLVGRSSVPVAEQMDADRPKTTPRPKLQRSLTVESCLVETNLGNVVAPRRAQRSNALDVGLDGMDEVGLEKVKAEAPTDGGYGPRKQMEGQGKENIYRSLPAKYLTSPAYRSGLSSGDDSDTSPGAMTGRSARHRAMDGRLLFQRSSSLDDADRKPLARGGQHGAPLMGSKVMATRHGSLLQIPKQVPGSMQVRTVESRLPSQQLRRQPGLGRGGGTRMASSSSSHGHLPNQVNRDPGLPVTKPNVQIRHPQKQYVLFRSRGSLQTSDGDDDNSGLREKHLSKSVDDLTDLKAAANTSKISAESDPSNNTTLQQNERERYLREWAVCKPKALLLSQEDLTRTSSKTRLQQADTLPRTQKPIRSHETTGKERLRDFFTIRRGKLSRAKKSRRSKTLDSREHLALYGKAARLLGSDPALFRDEGQGRQPCGQAEVNNQGRGQCQEKEKRACSAQGLVGPAREGSWSTVDLKQKRSESCLDSKEVDLDDVVKGHTARTACQTVRKNRTESAGNRRKSNLKVTNPEDMKYQRSALGGSSVAVSQEDDPMQACRRHTVSVPNLGQNTNQKAVVDEKDAFLDLLASRYPAHAHTIKAVKEWERPADASRRRTTQVVHVMPEGSVGPRPVSQDSRMMGPRDEEDSPTGTFTRGGRLRSSLPVVRSPNKSLERPMGLVFLTFRSETKRALLPNEVTSLDTVRALFVRSFSECLSMQWFDIPSHKIYILDQKTNVFYELDDVREVKDRAVLKIYETGLPPPAPGSPTPHSPQAPDYLTLHQHQHHGGYESDSSIRSAPSGPGVPGSGVRSPLHHPPLSPRLYQAAKAQTVAGHNGTYACPQQIKNTYATPYPPGQHPPSQLPLGQPQQGVSSHWSPTLHTHQHIVPATQRAEGQYAVTQSNQSSPQRVQHIHQAVASNQRHSLACLPDPNTYSDGRISQSRSYHDYPNGVPPSQASGTATPTHTDSEAKTRMDHMEAQLANLAAWVQTTVMKNQTESSRPGSARSNSSVMSEGSYSAKSSMSDISSATPQPLIGVDMQNTIRTLHYHTRDLRAEVNKLRRLQMTNMEAIRESIHDTYKKLKEVIEFVPGAADQPVRFQRHQINYKVKDYKDDGKQIREDLIDLEKSVEELRNDVLNRKCRVNVTEIENMALALSNIAKSLGELKAHFPALQEEMKTVMQGEMEIVVEEEKFIREEPEKLESSLKRCKKLTGTLATLRRLAIVQEHNDPVIPVIPALEANEEDHLAILEEIKCMVPDHSARLTSVQAAEGARERKKKIDSRGESLRFEKSLALAHRQLKEPAVNAKDHPTAGLHPVKEESLDMEKAGHASQESNAKCDTKCDEVIKKTSAKHQLNKESFLAQCKDEENYISAVRLSAFEHSSPLLANGDSAQDGTARSKTLSPSWTSTPKDQNHAMVSGLATESSLSPVALATSGQEGKKKIPPPPPPRRSSRSSMKSPTPPVQKPSVNAVDDEQSLHMYENLDDLNASEAADKGKDVTSEQSVAVGSPGSRTQRPKSASCVPRSESAPKERPKSQYSPTKSKGSPTKGQFSPTKGQSSPTRGQYSPTKMKKLNKFQQELAAGIYSNLNRPDLQHQNINPAFVVQDTTSPESSSGNSSSSTSLDSQLGGTIKRNKNVKTDDKQSGGSTEQKKSPTGKGRKIPPPPPQRKTSTLSQQKDSVTATEKLKGDAKADPSCTDDRAKDLRNGGSARTECPTSAAEEISSQGMSKTTKDINGSRSSGKTTANSSPPLRIHCGQQQLAQVQPNALQRGQPQASMMQPGAKQAGQLQLASSKSMTGCTPSKLTTVSNGDVSKTTKPCSVKVEVRSNRKFEETEIY